MADSIRKCIGDKSATWKRIPNRLAQLALDAPIWMLKLIKQIRNLQLTTSMFVCVSKLGPFLKSFLGFHWKETIIRNLPFMVQQKKSTDSRCMYTYRYTFLKFNGWVQSLDVWRWTELGVPIMTSGSHPFTKKRLRRSKRIETDLSSTTTVYLLINNHISPLQIVMIVDSCWWFLEISPNQSKW